MSNSIDPNPRPYDPSQPVGQSSPPKKSGLGCWFWGCLGTLVFTLLAMVGLGFGTYWFLSGQLAKYTDTQPADIPVIEMDETELKELQRRIETFTNQVKGETEEGESTDNNSDITKASPPDGETSAEETANEKNPEATKTEPIQELVLTADEINALIASEEQLKGRIFVRIEEGRVFGEVSIPTDMIPGGGGRFFNADAEFDVSMQDGILEVRLTDASVKGERIPDTVLEGFSQENLAKDAYKDRKNAEMLRKFKSIEVVDDSIVLKLKEMEPEATAPPETETVQ